MNAFILIPPLFLIRYGILAFINPAALKRAAHFPPMIGYEKIVFYIYQIATLCILISTCFLKVKTNGVLFYVGSAVYALAVLFLIVSTVNFANPTQYGINQNGLYLFSRNPMYLGYFGYFLGIAFLTRSFVLFALLAIFQISTHWIILAEERWCKEVFGQPYTQYMKKVRRYF